VLCFRSNPGWRSHGRKTLLASTRARRSRCLAGIAAGPYSHLRRSSKVTASSPDIPFAEFKFFHIPFSQNSSVRALHVIPSVSPSQGGPSFALPLIARSLAQAGVTVDVATTDDDGPGGRLSVPLGQRVERDGFDIWHFAKQTEFYKVSLPFRSWVRRHIREYDLVHIHALFSFT